VNLECGVAEMALVMRDQKVGSHFGRRTIVEPTCAVEL
jgi:hypothetical protein